MSKFQITYYDYSGEPLVYSKTFKTEQEADKFIEDNYSDDIGSDVRINDNGDDEWYTKTGVWNPEENEYFPSAYVEPAGTEYVDESKEFQRMQELAGINLKKNYTVSIKDNKESFNTPKEVKGYIDDVFKNTNKYLLSDVVITSKDGDRVEIHKLHQHYQDNY